MKINTLAALLLCSCATQHSASKAVKARITYYDSHEDKYGSKLAIGGRAHEGLTMAAPSALPFKTTVIVPELFGKVGSGKFTIQDRGSALERAYRHGQLRLDVYVDSRTKLNWLKKYMPEFMDTIIQ